ncbi:MAG: hypothetical protein KAT16_02895 [Candidatus Heimdallarchaeota archaeon]|nr:hypothetical protein [Candidatus Heimdallarchaeota archaeon]
MELGGLDELDTQVKLYQLGVKSFSPYADQSKVDMIIRTEVDEIVRYADIKVCTGVLEDDRIVWKFNFSFFLKNESFFVLSVRLPDQEEIMRKHHIILESKTFLEIIKKEKITVEDNKWILSLPFSDLQQLTEKKRSKKLPKLVNAFKPFFDNWKIFVKWKEKPNKPKS